MSRDDQDDGYRLTPAGGVKVRSDIVDVYLVRRGIPAPVESAGGEAAREGTGEASVRDAAGPEVLQLFRTGEPMGATWQPVMGHMEPGETAVTAALRELSEEVGLAPSSPHWLGIWALEQVHPYYITAIDTIVLSPRFVVEVAPAWQPRLNREHSQWRWICLPAAREHFMWPGQVAACQEIMLHVLPARSLAREALRVRLP